MRRGARLPGVPSKVDLGLFGLIRVATRLTFFCSSVPSEGTPSSVEALFTTSSSRPAGRSSHDDRARERRAAAGRQLHRSVLDVLLFCACMRCLCESLQAGGRFVGSATLSTTHVQSIWSRSPSVMILLSPHHTARARRRACGRRPQTVATCRGSRACGARSTDTRRAAPRHLHLSSPQAEPRVTFVVAAARTGDF